MLQNWYYYIEEKASEGEGRTKFEFIEKDRFFKLNIGGEDFDIWHQVKDTQETNFDN